MEAKITSGFKFYLDYFVNLKGGRQVQQSEQDWMRPYLKQRRRQNIITTLAPFLHNRVGAKEGKDICEANQCPEQEIQTVLGLFTDRFLFRESRSRTQTPGRRGGVAHPPLESVWSCWARDLTHCWALHSRYVPSLSLCVKMLCGGSKSTSAPSL